MSSFIPVTTDGIVQTPLSSIFRNFDGAISSVAPNEVAINSADNTIPISYIANELCEQTIMDEFTTEIVGEQIIDDTLNLQINNNMLSAKETKTLKGSKKRKCKFVQRNKKILKVENLSKDLKQVLCVHCSNVFSHEQFLRKHIRREHKLIKCFSCEICTKLFASRVAVFKHLTSHFQRETLSLTSHAVMVSCKQCNSMFLSKVMLQYHMEYGVCKAKSTNAFLCHMCKKSYKLLLSLEKHLGTHSQIDCPVCLLKFGSFQLYKNHVALHTKEEIENFRSSSTTISKVKKEQSKKSKDKLFICSICAQTFNRQIDFQKHKFSHTGVTPWKCPECDQSFLSSSKYKEHYTTVHEKNAKPFFCRFCNKNFTNPEGLKMHEQAHQGIKPFQCEVCEKRFTQRGNLKDHLLIHSDKRPWECNQCDKAFKIKGDLTKHLVVHTGVKNFACSYCEMRFSRQSYLTRHTRTHTGEKPFVCDYCNKSFSRSENCQEHRRIHTGERPYVCHCGATFKDSGNFCNHKKLHDPHHPKRKRNKVKQTNSLAETLQPIDHSTSIIQVLPNTVFDGNATGVINLNGTNPAVAENDYVMHLGNLLGNGSAVASVGTLDHAAVEDQLVTLTINDVRLLNMLQAAAGQGQMHVEVSDQSNLVDQNTDQSNMIDQNSVAHFTTDSNVIIADTNSMFVQSGLE